MPFVFFLFLLPKSRCCISSTLTPSVGICSHQLFAFSSFYPYSAAAAAGVGQELSNRQVQLGEAAEETRRHCGSHRWFCICKDVPRRCAPPYLTHSYVHLWALLCISKLCLYEIVSSSLHLSSLHHAAQCYLAATSRLHLQAVFASSAVDPDSDLTAWTAVQSLFCGLWTSTEWSICRESCLPCLLDKANFLPCICCVSTYIRCPDVVVDWMSLCQAPGRQMDFA